MATAQSINHADTVQDRKAMVYLNGQFNIGKSPRDIFPIFN